MEDTRENLSGLETEEQEWKEMAAEIGSYFPFKEQFKQFVDSHEKEKHNG